MKEDFPVTASKGEQINPYVCYNPTDDTYLVNWEDFRNVSEWMDQGDIYGALLDGAGNIQSRISPCAMIMNQPTAGDQRHNNIAYNPDKNEFFVAGPIPGPTLDNVGIVGRFIRADGTPAGPDFTAADAAGLTDFPPCRICCRSASSILLYGTTAAMMHRVHPGEMQKTETRMQNG